MAAPGGEVQPQLQQLFVSVLVSIWRLRVLIPRRRPTGESWSIRADRCRPFRGRA